MEGIFLWGKYEKPIGEQCLALFEKWNKMVVKRLSYNHFVNSLK